MYESTYPAICAQVNHSFEVRQFVQYVGYFPEKLQRDNDIYLALCPIHRETVFRSLVINPRNNTYQCRHLACPGNAAADFLDLLVRVRGQSLPEVIRDAVTHFGPEYFRLTPSQIVVVDELVAHARSLRDQRQSR